MPATRHLAGDSQLRRGSLAAEISAVPADLHRLLDCLLQQYIIFRATFTRTSIERFSVEKILITTAPRSSA